MVAGSKLNKMEQFKTIRGFSLYKISNLGNVINNHGRILKPQKKISKTSEYDGPVIGIINDNGIRKFKYIKRLIADAFIKNVDGYNVLIEDLDKPVILSNLTVLNPNRNPRN